MSYFEANWSSLRAHTVPEWYDGAKFGMFVHWGPAAIPAFAPTEGNVHEVAETYGHDQVFKHMPYAMWYCNSLRIEGSPVQAYHKRQYGEDYDYDNFCSQFKETSKKFDAKKFAQFAADSGARYVVMVTKHHDGFLMWPSSIRNPFKDELTSDRDLVGEIADAVREKGLKFGVYYSSALDWSFQQGSIQDYTDLLTNGPVTEEYTNYCESHWRELIDRVKPSVLWGDIGYPPGSNLQRLFADFYNKIPEGVVNDRWVQFPAAGHWFVKTWLGRKFVNRVIEWILRKRLPPDVPHCDFQTPEYSVVPEARKKKWEATRGVGTSFCYNSQETDSFLTQYEAMALLLDCTAKNGNLLLNVGPKPDGSIPLQQESAFLAIGALLKHYGTAIYDTHPWVLAETTARVLTNREEGAKTEGKDARVWFTSRQGSSLDEVFAIVMLGGADSMSLDERAQWGDVHLLNMPSASKDLVAVQVPVDGSAAKHLRWSQASDRLVFEDVAEMGALPAIAVLRFVGY